MELKNMTKEELETLSYTDVAFLILKDEKKSMNTPNVFKRVCELLDAEDIYESSIGDFYTSLTTDKRFTLLDNAEWDLRDNHSIKISIDDEDDEEEIEETEEETEEVENENLDDELETPIDDEEIVDSDDDLDDLAIIDGEEELEED